MSERYPGGIITKSTTTPTGPYQNGTAPGVWTLDQQLQFQQQGIWPTAGLLPNYIEDVFSTYLYTGNATARSIVNDIDISGKGGLVWTKSRSLAGSDHYFVDTARGATKYLNSNNPAAQVSTSDITAFNSNGYSLNADVNGGFNNSGATFVSWTFRKQAKFFDIVTYTGTSSVQNIAHNLGSTPGCIIIKRTNSTSNWAVYHRGTNGGTNPQNYFTLLSTSDAQSSATSYWDNTAPTSTQFTVGGGGIGNVNYSGSTYVAYLFASDAGGFGNAGTDNVITCGSYTTTGNDTITLGYEPQFIIEKRVNATSDWHMWDVMRGMSYTNLQELEANTSAAEVTIGSTGYVKPLATGYNSTYWSAGQTVIYIAIRRGPMATPTLGTSVFSPVQYTSSTNITTGFPVDLVIGQARSTTSNPPFLDRLRGSSGTLSNLIYSTTTGAETTTSYGTALDNNTGITTNYWPVVATPAILWNFRRAPGFFDEVCYTGTGSATTFSHNLQAVPELMIVKMRSSTNPWRVYSAPTLATTYLALNTDAATTTSSANWNDTAPTSSVFTVGTGTGVNGSGGTYVNYLFATCAGVSKVGSYTGNGSTQTINCGFTGGARFVLIKRTDSTGDWYVYDTARGMTVLTDPYLLLNSTAAEAATLGSVTTVSTGFALNSTILAAINVNAGTYIFLAIA